MHEPQQVKHAVVVPVPSFPTKLRPAAISRRRLIDGRGPRDLG
jgi:hypothetical protein